MESRFYKNIALAFFIGTLGFVILCFFTPSAIFPVVGFASITILMIPGWKSNRMELFNTWNFMVLNVIIGLTIRSLYIYFGWADQDLLDFYYFNGQSGEFFFPAAGLLLASLCVFTFGYIAGPKTRQANFTFYSPSQVKLFAMAALLGGISLFATIKYIQATGGVANGIISAKRTNLAIEYVQSHRTYGPYRLMASLAFFAHLLLLADTLRDGVKFRFVKNILMVFFFLLACVLPFYASARTPIAIYFCASLATYYYARFSVPWARIGFVSAFAILVMGLMTAYRRISASTNTQTLLENFNPLQSIVLDRNNIGLAKTAHILAAIPDTLTYQYGATMWVWFVAWIPRSVWPSKPAIAASNKEIGAEVFNLQIAGVPPGLVAELHWNFHIIGSLFIIFFVGMLLKYIHEKFKPKRGGDPLVAILYVVGPMQLGFLIIGHSLGYGLFNAFLNMLIMYMIIMLVRDKGRVVQRNRIKRRTRRG